MAAGILFVLSAPSGTGKTTLLGRVMERIPGLNFSVSHTTRQPRNGESDGRDYHFVERGLFERMIAENSFLEWAEVHGNLYGTSAEAVARQLTAGDDVVLDIDVQGAAIIRDSGKLAAVHIFIAPPGLGELERRLRGRQTESEQTIRLRLENARQEMEAVGVYDYLVINDELEEAARVLEAIIVAERARARRRPSGEPLHFEDER